MTHDVDDSLLEGLGRLRMTSGLEQEAVVQEAIQMWLEGAEDVELVDARRRGPWVDWPTPPSEPVAREPNPPQDYGFMQLRTFGDLDGHRWEVLNMDPAHLEPAT